MQNYKILFIISSFNIDKIQKAEEIAANLGDNKKGNHMKYLFQNFMIVFLIEIYIMSIKYYKSSAYFLRKWLLFMVISCDCLMIPL